MIRKSNIENIFRELDQVLMARGKTQELTVFGSGALMIQGISDDSRTTEDVDVVKPPFDNEMWVSSAEAGDKFNLEVGWLNTAGEIFSRNFPKGWEDRTLLVFEGKNLKVFSLSRQDMICTKFQALCDRGLDTDMEDMQGLSPSKDELEIAKKWVVEQKPELLKSADRQVKRFLGEG